MFQEKKRNLHQGRKKERVKLEITSETHSFERRDDNNVNVCLCAWRGGGEEGQIKLIFHRLRYSRLKVVYWATLECYAHSLRHTEICKINIYHHHRVYFWALTVISHYDLSRDSQANIIHTHGLTFTLAYNFSNIYVPYLQGRFVVVGTRVLILLV